VNRRLSKLFLTAVVVFTYLILLLSIAETAVVSQCDANAPSFTRRDLIRILKRDGISIPIERDGKLNRLGNIKIGVSCYTIYTYELSFQPAANPHYTARVLVLRERKYIGMYDVDELPISITANVIEFSSVRIFRPDWPGHEIVFDKNGPPKKVLLDGQFREFFK